MFRRVVLAAAVCAVVVGAAVLVPAASSAGGGDAQSPKPLVRPTSGGGAFVFWPGNVTGFLVVRADDRTNVTAYDPVVDRRFTLRPPECGAGPPSRISVTAYRDSDGDGEFDPETDRPFRRNGSAVSVTLGEDCRPVPPSATTTEPPSGNATATEVTTTNTTPRTADATAAGDGPLSGDLTPAAVLGLCAAFLVVALVGRRLRPGG